MRKIVHIYYNTSGNSGLYLNPIYDALANEYKQTLFVNKYFPLKNDAFKSILFPLTERNENNSHKYILRCSFIRKIVRFAELLIGNRMIVKFVKNNVPDIINYSLTNMPYALRFLRKLIKVSPNSRIVVTCHDVVPFASTSRIAYSDIYRVADYLIVHTENAIDTLVNQFNVPRDKILFHPFPIIDLSLLRKDRLSIRSDKKICFLFLGVMRKEKGVQTLVDAWASLGESFEANLVIAGFKPDDVDIDFSQIAQFKNVRILNKMLSDSEYYSVVNSSDYVVFPYLQVGNSGVLSSVISLGKVPITSKLKTFEESSFVSSPMMFTPGDHKDLAALLTKIKDNHEKDYSRLVEQVTFELDKTKCNFASEVIQAYSRIR